VINGGQGGLKMNPSSFYLKIVAGIIFNLLFLLTTAQAASFDCKKAKTEVEKLICSNEELSKLDESLNEAYQRALNRTDIKQQTIKSQRQWLKYQRNMCQDAECIKNAYESRIKELGFTSSFGIVIFRDPNLRMQLPTKTIAEVPKPQVLEPCNNVSIVAGCMRVNGFKDGFGAHARFDYPFGITTDGTNLYVSETNNHTIRKIAIATGMVSILAGSPGKRGAVDGVGRVARFNFPWGLATDGINLYVAEVGNNDIRKIVIATGKVTTLAGTPGRAGCADGTGILAQFSHPSDLIIAGKNLYVADQHNATIRRVVIATCEVTTFAGTAKARGATDGIGSMARFTSPGGITTDGLNLYVADNLNRNIRKIAIATGEVTTLAGPDETVCIREGWHGRCPGDHKDNSGTMARFNNPTYLTTDGTNLYVTEAHDLIRKIDIATSDVTTLPCASRASGSTAGIMGITNDGSSLYLADVLGHTIIKIQ